MYTQTGGCCFHPGACGERRRQEGALTLLPCFRRSFNGPGACAGAVVARHALLSPSLSPLNCSSDKQQQPRAGVTMASRLELALNDSVRLTTAGGEAVSGAVHALDEQTHTLVLRLAGPAAGSEDGAAPPAGGGHLLRFFCVNTLSSIEVVGGEGSGENGAGAGQQDISEDRLAKLEREARARSQREMGKINPSAPPKGQMAFDAISKIYSDCRWSGQSIVIMDQLRIDPPYTKADIKTLDASAKADFIDRLGNMLEKVGKKLKK